MLRKLCRLVAFTAVLTVTFSMQQGTALACDCGGNTMQEMLDSNDVAMRVIIVKSSVSDGVVSHAAWVAQVWKGNFKRGQLVRIVTSLNGDDCGHGVLQPGAWLVSANSDGFRVHIDSCVSVVLWAGTALPEELLLFQEL